MNVKFGRKKLSKGSKGTYAYGMSKVLNCKKENIKCNNIIQQYKYDKFWLYCKKT